MSLTRLGVSLVVAGLLLATIPTLAVRLADLLVESRRAADVAQWSERRPAPAPAPSRHAEPVEVLAPGDGGYLLEIPKLHLKAVVRELEADVFTGRNTPRLKRFGLGQVPFSESLRNVSPGDEGTAVIAGHRTTSGAPFRDLHRLGPGDAIVLRRGSAEQHWTVVYAVVVAPDRVDVIRSRPDTRRLAIMACSPPFSAAERLIVFAELARSGGAGSDAVSTPLRGPFSSTGAGDQSR
ncbi:MAG: sortase [Armatimonadota bacterium]|nr:sortase [Armatimonadota bacterium]